MRLKQRHRAAKVAAAINSIFVLIFCLVVTVCALNITNYKGSVNSFFKDKRVWHHGGPVDSWQLAQNQHVVCIINGLGAVGDLAGKTGVFVICNQSVTSRRGKAEGRMKNAEKRVLSANLANLAEPALVGTSSVAAADSIPWRYSRRKH